MVRSLQSWHGFCPGSYFFWNRQTVLSAFFGRFQDASFQDGEFPDLMICFEKQQSRALRTTSATFQTFPIPMSPMERPRPKRPLSRSQRFPPLPSILRSVLFFWWFGMIPVDHISRYASKDVGYNFDDVLRGRQQLKQFWIFDVLMLNVMQTSGRKCEQQ